VVIWGVHELKKKEIGPRKKRGTVGLGESEPNRSGSSEPDRFMISYLKGDDWFFLFIFQLLSLSSFFLEREALPSL